MMDSRMTDSRGKGSGMTDSRVTVSRVVVGVDGSEESLGALRWALAQARLLGASLEVVHAWHYPYAAYTDVTGMAPGVVTQEDLEKVGQLVLEGSLRAAGANEGDVPVKPVLVQGGAAEALLRAAAGADLLVVGSRGRGGFAGLLLGSVSQQCAHHVPCPLVIVPHTS